MLTSPPSVIAVVPPPTANSTTITVTFSEDVVGANLASNFKLFNSQGAAIPITGDSYSSANFTATLSLNAGNPLPSNIYTLFVVGNNITSAAVNGNTLPLAQPGQLVVANTQANTISTLDMPGNGNLGTLSDYGVPPAGSTQAAPAAVAFADLNSDGLPDMIVASGGSNTVAIFAGQKGGGFSQSPSLTLNLPSGANPAGIVVGDFNGDGKPDLAVLDSGTNQVSVFLNTSTVPGSFVFGAANNVGAGNTPVAIVAADFNSDNKTDLAVASSAPDGGGDYDVVVLKGDGTGNFTTAATIAVGTTAPSDLTSPTGLAVGQFDSDTLPDLVVSGTGGISVLTNTSSGSTISFGIPTFITADDTTSVTTGIIRNNPQNNKADILATSNAHGGELLAFLNDDRQANPTNFVAAGPLAAGVAAPTGITLKDLTGSGSLNVLYVNNSTNGSLTAAPALQTGLITGATNTSPIIITTPGTATGLMNGQQVIIQGVEGDTAANGTFYISNVTVAGGVTTFTLNGSTGNGTYTTNTGTWIAVPGIITGVTGTANGPITITSPNNGLVTGQQVTISGVGGFTAANGTFFITRIDANTFSLNGTSGTGTYAADTGSFTRAPYTVDANPRSLALADTNGDGVLDVATANSGGLDVSLLLGSSSITAGTGDGTFLASTSLSVSSAATPGPSAVAVGNLFGNGLNDLVVADTNSNQISIFQALPGGGYAAPMTLSTGGLSPVSVAIGDLDDDGRPDIVVANQGDNTVSIFLSNNSGGFNPATMVSVGNTPTQVVLGDFNNDGILDMAVAHNSGTPATSGVSILLGNGDGTFQARTEVASGVAATAIVLGDFNNDGKLDFVVADASGAGSVNLYLGNGTGQFVASGSVDVVPDPTALAAADFNRDGFLDVVAVSGLPLTAENVGVALNAGGTGFGSVRYTTLPTDYPINSVTVANVNQDAFPDLVLGLRPGLISAATNTGPIVITSANNGLQNGQQITVAGVQGNTAANGIWTVSNVTTDSFTLNGSTGNGAYTGGGFWFTGAGAYDNAVTLLGAGNGTFTHLTPYDAGGTGAPPVVPSSVSVVSDPFLAISTFNFVSNLVTPDLMRNGSFDAFDLAGEQGNLDGWQTYDQPDPSGGSAGRWGAQTGMQSPLSLTTVPGPVEGTYAAMLDEQNLVPYDPTLDPFGNPNTNASFAGSHAIYQDVTIPSNVTSAQLTFTLYIDNSESGNGYTNTSNGTASLSYILPNNAANQQVRVDLLNPNAAVLAVNADAANNPGVLQNLFITDPSQQSRQTVLRTIDVSAYAGKTIRFRVASANNRGQLLVGLDKVHLDVRYLDSTQPSLTSLGLQNPSFLSGPGNPQQSSNPVLVGHVNDNGSINNINHVEIIFNNVTPGTQNDFQVTTFDANGNFSFTPPANLNLLPGQQSATVKVFDDAGNVATQPFTFIVQGPSLTDWQEQGPGPINVSNQFVDYKTISGNVTTTLVDPTDPSGNTIYVGSDNGGVWKSTDGGNDWTAMTDNVIDATTGQRVPEAIGALGIGHNPATGVTVLYAATGWATGAFNNSFAAQGGTGVLVSIDGGTTWTNTGQNVLAGAHVTGMVVDPTNPDVAYVAVGYFDDPTKQPGVFKTTNRGQSWVNVLTPADMFPNGLGNGTLPVGTQLASVTSIVMDPFDSTRLLVGLGNIGQAPLSSTAGVWESPDSSGASWVLQKGGDNANIPNATLPFGTSVGRVTIALGNGKVGDEKYTYVMIGTVPPTSTAPGTIDEGHFDGEVGTVSGLYRSKDGLLNFTKVMLSQQSGFADSQNGPNDWENINLLGNDASDVGALLVDPTDPNIVFVGGSRRYESDFLDHALVEVDTGDMLDTTARDPINLKILNNGDDIQKNLAAELEWELLNNAFDANNLGEYPNKADYHDGIDDKTNTLLDHGEGVAWYDLEQAANNKFGFNRNLPNAINSISIDPKGRLLFGTVNGVWRGVREGFGYDFTSGGNGITAQTEGVTAPANVPGITLTALNGNLQITDVTGVALDPNSPGRLYSSELNGGAALSSTGPNGWVSLGLTFNPGFVPSPSSGYVVTASPDPTLGPNQLTQLYLGWQFLNQQSEPPEFSSNSGATFVPYNGNSNNGISIQDPAQNFPPFALDPTKLQANGQFYNQLLLGTNRVYLANTSTNVWVPITGTLSPNGLVSAVAFAPSENGLVYAGTSDGKFFSIDVTNGNIVTDHSAGLSGTAIRAITVSPTNPQVVYVLTAGLSNNIFVSGNGGQSWTPLSGTTTGQKLPSAQLYSLVIDPRPQTGAPNGTLYLGTQIGVYTTVNGGQGWTPLGLGLPSAPVVNLVLNQSQNILAAAVQGRGEFELSVNRSGPQVIATTPTTPTVGPLTTIDVTFNEPVDPRTFTQFTDTASRSSAAAQIAASMPALTIRATSLYQEFLRRAPTPDELNTPVFNPLGPNLIPPLMILQAFGELSLDSDLISSQEYYNNAVYSPGHYSYPPESPNAQVNPTNNATWLSQAYVDMFGVTFDQAPLTPGYTTFLNVLNNGTLNRQQVVLGMLQQDQPLANISARIFNQILNTAKPDGTIPGKPADVNDPDLVPWEATLGPTDYGTSPIDLVLTLLGSEQFYQQNGGLQDLPAGSQPSAVALADLTGNKTVLGNPIPDLVLADEATNQIYIFQGLAGGGYASKPTLTLNLPQGPNGDTIPDALAVADFNGDGLLDIAVADKGSNKVTVFQNTTTGGILSFDSGTDFAAGNAPVALVTGTFDGTGKTDLAVLDSGLDNSNHYDVTILYGTGTNTLFTATPAVINTGFSSAPTSAPTGLAQGLLNNDTLPDLAVSGLGGLRVFLNTTTGGVISFTSGTSLTPTPTTSVAIGRVDTTSLNGIVATSNVVGGEVLVFQNSSTTPGTFTLGATVAAGPDPTSVALKDLNGDGLNDVVVANNSSAGTVTVLTNTTQAAVSGRDTVTFAAPVAYSVTGGNGSSPVALAVGDVNQDVASDIVTANLGVSTGPNQSPSSFYVLLGTRPGMFQTPSDDNFLNQSYLKVLNRPIDQAGLSTYVPTLNADQTVYLTGPAGTTSPLSITPTDSTNRTYQLTFAPQTLDGAYSLIVGPSALATGSNVFAIKDEIDLNGTFVNIGNPMNQNGNLVNGEYPQDRFTGPFAINNSDDGRFLSGLFHDLLNRDADNALFVNLIGPVDTGEFQSLAAIVPSFTTSTAYRTNVIDQLYNTFLQRNPTTGSGSELNTALAGLSNGTESEIQLEAQQLVGSQEFFDDATQGFPGPHSPHTQEGMSDTTGDTNWLNLAFQDVLGRLPTGYITNVTNASGNTGLITITTSTNHGLTTGEQVTITGVQGDTAANNTWTITVISPNQFSLNGSNGNATYTAGSGEWTSPSNPTEVVTLVSALDNNQLSVSQEATNLVFSNDGLRRIVNQTFVHFLGRTTRVDPNSGLDEAVANIALLQQTSFSAGQPSPYERMVDALLSSPEYFQHVGNNIPAWAASLYTKLPNTPSTLPSNPAAVTSSVLAGYAAARAGAVTGIVSTPEYQADLVVADYVKYLGTPPTTQDVLNWLAAFKAGLRDEQVLATVLSFNQYYPLTSSNSGWLNQVYNALLLRSPDTSDPTYQSYLNYLNQNSGTTTQLQAARYNVAYNIQVGDEYRRILIAGYFNTYLGASKSLPPGTNDPDVNNLLAFMDIGEPQTPGKTQEQVLAELLSDSQAPYPTGLTPYFQRKHQFP